jgi:Flp pilus assembly protein TadG
MLPITRQNTILAARPHRRRGAIMMEMVLCLPLLLLLIVFLLYFGSGIMRVQHSQVADRYVAWQQAEGAPGPTLDPNGVQMNQTFFFNNAQNVNSAADSAFPTDAGDDLTTAAGRYTADTQSLVAQALGDFPSGSRARFDTSYPNSVPVLQRFEGPITHQHIRIGNDWKFVNGWIEVKSEWKQSGAGPWMLQPVREYFYPDLDNRLANLIDQGNPLASGAASLYSTKPAYIGPTITYP